MKPEKELKKSLLNVAETLSPNNKRWQESSKRKQRSKRRLKPTTNPQKNRMSAQNLRRWRQSTILGGKLMRQNLKKKLLRSAMTNKQLLSNLKLSK